MKKIRWDIRRLECFVAVADELHFGRAAAKIGISQPPLTQHIQVLEHQVGTPLFSRENRTVTLTNAGKTLLAEAKRILGDLRKLDQVVDGIRSGQEGHVTVSCVPTALHDILPAIAHRFRKIYPGIALVLNEAHTSDVVQSVLQRRSDIGFAWEKSPPAPLKAREIRTGSFVAALPPDHRLAHEAVIRLSDLADDPLVLTPRNLSPYHYDSVLAAFKRLGRTPRVAYEVATVLSQIGYVASGFGVALLPPFAQNLGVAGVCFRSIGEEAIVYSISLIWNPQNESLALKAFTEVVNDVTRSVKVERQNATTHVPKLGENAA